MLKLLICRIPSDQNVQTSVDSTLVRHWTPTNTWKQTLSASFPQKMLYLLAVTIFFYRNSWQNAQVFGTNNIEYLISSFYFGMFFPYYSTPTERTDCNKTDLVSLSPTTNCHNSHSLIIITPKVLLKLEAAHSPQCSSRNSQNSCNMSELTPVTSPDVLVTFSWIFQDLLLAQFSWNYF